jgi:hypothetical protein
MIESKSFAAVSEWLSGFCQVIEISNAQGRILMMNYLLRLLDDFHMIILFDAPINGAVLKIVVFLDRLKCSSC